jgi:hypothetical protein
VAVVERVLVGEREAVMVMLVLGSTTSGQFTMEKGAATPSSLFPLFPPQHIMPTAGFTAQAVPPLPAARLVHPVLTIPM